MHPGGIAHKFLQERAADNRAGLTPAADIFNIGKIALDLLAVLLKQGQLPHPLGARIPGGAQPVHHGLIGPHHARRLAPERHHHRTGQGRQIDDAGRLELLHGVGQRIGEDQAALGVRVDHLHGFA